MTAAPTILVFDSGLGGLTVFREVLAARPDARFVYAADDAFFPYGRQDEAKLVARVLDIMEHLIAEHRPDLVVIACNTASTLVLPQLREKFKVPFVGTVPAIKPACSTSNSKLVSVLGTEATVKREYTRMLIAEHRNNCLVTLVGSPRLAELAEAALKGESVPDADVAAEIAPCFIEANGARTDTVVLACTHYPLLLERLTRLAPWPVKYLDPAPAIARRVAELLRPPVPGAPPTGARAVFTSGRAPAPALAAALGRFGLAESAAADV
ncbi:MAG: glutamate racemase [Alphaproteobacteria bacterium]|jgi:glutamate racemase|nr:glutamate racemase [Alphaproteobacteria bacterium]